MVYQNLLRRTVARDYGLPNVYMLSNWVTHYNKKFEKGAVSLLHMDTKTKDPKALKAKIKQLEKALEKANVMIYGLNSMIDLLRKNSRSLCEKSMVPNGNAEKRTSHYKDGYRASL